MTARKPLTIASGQRRQLQATETLQTSACTTANASVNAPHGTAPSSPVDGDMWTTSAGIYVRINGVTVGPLVDRVVVDAAVAGLSWKQSVRAATTVAGTLASSFENGDAIDGVTLTTGDRILIKNQASGAENGIYTVNASGAPTRATDADSGAELVNASCYVSEGLTLADTQWTCTTNAPIVVNTTALTWAQLSTTPTNATTTEQLTGTDSTKTATPDSVAALWEKGSNVASASTTTLGEGGFFHITGTTNITAFAFSVDKAGRTAWLSFDSILTLTHNATSLILPGSANIVTAADDRALIVSEGSGNFRVLVYQKADASALVSSSSGGGIDVFNHAFIGGL